MNKFVLAVFGTLVQPAFAETAWEKLDRGIEVVRECAGDVRQYCKEVKPGDGRIKACVLGHLKDMSTPCLTALAARVVTLAQDNLETPEGGVATIMSDEFFNVYDKTGPGMSNYKP